MRNETELAIDATERLLQHASEIDPVAWKSPLPARMMARRTRSYAQAVAEMKAAIKLATGE